MELYITGDTHGDFSRFRPESFYEQERLTKEDVILVAGDFGGVWYGDSRDDAGLNFLDSRPFTTAFVSGNHENYDALAAYPQAEWHGGRVRTIRPSVLMLERGQVFDLGGRMFFVMGGASSHDIQDGILEPSSMDRASGSGRAGLPAAVPAAQRPGRSFPGQPPLLVAGGAAQRSGVCRGQGQPGPGRVDGGLPPHPLRSHQHPERPAGAAVQTDCLEGISQRCRFKYHFFGHYHENEIIREKYVLLYEQIIRLK